MRRLLGTDVCSMEKRMAGNSVEKDGHGMHKASALWGWEGMGDTDVVGRVTEYH